MHDLCSLAVDWVTVGVPAAVLWSSFLCVHSSTAQSAAALLRYRHSDILRTVCVPVWLQSGEIEL